MTEDKKKARAKILKKPIHDRATRKVSALPELIKQSERPDGEKVETLEPSPASGGEPDPPTKEIGLEVSVEDGGLFDDLFSDAEDD